MAHGSFVRSALAGLGLVLFAGNAAAQTLTVTPGTSLQVGGTAKIAYENSSLAGTTVTVTVSGGFPVPTTVNIEIQLDAKGKGTGSWTVVSGWRTAYFDAPGATSVSIPIV